MTIFYGSHRAAPGAALAATLIVLASACGGAEAPRRGAGELETVDVAAPIDAAATIELDAVATPRPAGAAAGVLPGGFPKEVPLPNGGSLVDYGDGVAGPWIELVVAAPPAEVESEYRARLARAGFRAGADGVWARGSLRLTVGVTARGAASTVRLEPVAR